MKETAQIYVSPRVELVDLEGQAIIATSDATGFSGVDGYYNPYDDEEQW